MNGKKIKITPNKKEIKSMVKKNLNNLMFIPFLEVAEIFINTGIEVSEKKEEK